ncbi:guanylate-binding protein [Dunaliella salina]|uniref:Guanylate-binding protein n=1 Tax=Dunaliella salina TaxID=3046 RepID=A0ABQ7H9W2_DUNSA|nr:guanylate-binding protein [Dunaliella salina]|eukprot:KAF5843640.1 guanylate-binding protein [Dunaliella salina]
MWSDPLRHENGAESYNTVLLDTEGIDAYDQTAQYSTQIFSLAVLLSCLFVYNHMGGIDESALDRLSLVTEMTKHVRVRAGQAKEGDLDSLSEFAPSFLWLLRDFYLKLEEDGRKITAAEYLETALHPVAGEGQSVASKNEIRGSIKALFKDRDCFSLVRPMHDEMALANLDTVPKDQLRPEFTQGVKKLVELIFSKSKPKRFANGLMSGPVLAGLVEAYVEAINKGAVPTIATAWQGVAESESRRACDLAEATYKQSFDAAIVPDEAALLAEHQRCLSLAVATFKEVSVGDESIRRAHEAKFLESVQRYFNDYSGRKLAEAAAHVNEMLYKANMSMNKAVRQGSSLASMQDDLSNFIEDFVASTHGPTKWEKLAEFLKEAYPAMANEAISKAQACSKEELEALQTHLEEAHAKIEELEELRSELEDAHARIEELEGVQSQLEAAEGRARALEEVRAQLGEANAKIKALEARAVKAERLSADTNTNIASLQSQLATEQQEVEALRVELDAKEGHVAALEAQLEDIAQSSERRAASAEQEAEAKIQALEAECGRQASEMQAFLSSEQLRTQGIQSDLAARAAKVSALEQQVDSLNTEVTDWRSRYNGAIEEKVQVMQERDEARDEVAALQSKRDVSSRQQVTATIQLQELQARMEKEEKYKADVQARLDSMIEEARAARTEALAARSGKARHALQAAQAAMSSRGDVEGEDEDEEGIDAMSTGDAFSRMSISEIKDQLTQLGHEEAVWALQSKRPAPKRSEWVELARSVPVA